MAFPRKIDIEALQELYYNKELSGQEVAKELGVYLSSVYKSMRRNNLPRRSPEETNKLRFKKTPLSFGMKTKLSLEEEKLKIAGIMLYAAEGAKSNPKTRH